jgi:hypothetical protein
MTTSSVPPPPTSQPHQLRRVNAYWCAQGCVVFGVLAVAALVARALLPASFAVFIQMLGLGAAGLAIASALGAVVFRVFETPREVAARDTEGPGERR